MKRTAAYLEGFEAYRNGRTLSENPFDVGPYPSRMVDDWDRGWKEAETIAWDKAKLLVDPRLSY